MKTWEMLRDIREGETYEAIDDHHYYVTLNTSGYVQYSGTSTANLTGPFLSKTWRKRTPVIVVDFAKAFAAYEKGARIKPAAWTDATYLTRTNESFYSFSAEQIRGKWIVEGRE